MSAPVIGYPSKIDYSQFDSTNPDPATKYGLPKDVKFCKKCTLSNQRPIGVSEFKNLATSKKQGVDFSEKGVCSPCLIAEQKANEISWNDRELELKELCDRFRSKDGSYDCIVPGSGGKDSFYAAHILKYKYHMHPLTVTWAPHIYTEWGWHNFRSWLNAGFSNVLYTPNPRVHRLLTRLALDKLLHPFQPFALGQRCFPSKVAAELGIPLVFYGEHESEYNSPISEVTTAQRDFRYFVADDFSQIYLSGVSVDQLLNDFGLTQGDLSIYFPIKLEEMNTKKIEVHHLGYYLRWHPQGCFYYAVENGGFKPSPERTPGTYSKYSSIDDRIDDYHFYTTYIKFGIGRATYDAAQEIRNGDINREEGVALVKKFDGEWPERFMDEIFRYLSITLEEYPIASTMFEQPIMDKEYFMRLCDNFRSPHLWKREDGEWRLRHSVFNG
ncbi:MAG: N-acetyl sugar amidotransferase [Holosporales bacterium]|jgi:N-acetyl sugar amidotransferase|nr:N-acetyl sugar amidotransferase [Holosporales bacterium]